MRHAIKIGRFEFVTASILLSGAAMFTFLPYDQPGISISDEQLASVRGADKTKYYNDSYTCDQYMAIMQNAAGGVNGNVAQGGCNVANANGANATFCWSCNAPGTNVMLDVKTGPGPHPPGLTDKGAVTCGPATSGFCDMVNGVPTCSNRRLTTSNCSDITEWWNQPTGSDGS